MSSLRHLKKRFRHYWLNFWLPLLFRFWKPDGLNREKRTHHVIVSLTTIPSRIDAVTLTVECILRQTYKPDEIHLYLGKELFENVPLPASLEALCKRGLKIFYRKDLKPHTKYFYAITENPNAVVITVDDDILYPSHLIETLMRSFEKHPRMVSCMRAHWMQFGKEGELLSYEKWKKAYYSPEPSMQYMPTGVGGVLYPPHIFHPETFNVISIQELAPKQDDLWLKFMAVMNNTPSVVLGKNLDLVTVRHTQEGICLRKSNVNENQNNIQIEAILKGYNHYFGDSDPLLQRIKQNRV